MPVKPVSIIVDREKRDVTPGLVQGLDLINLAGITTPEQLLLEISGDIDVPVSPTDVISFVGTNSSPSVTAPRRLKTIYLCDTHVNGYLKLTQFSFKQRFKTDTPPDFARYRCLGGRAVGPTGKTPIPRVA